MAKRRSWAGLVMVLILLAVLAAWWWPGGSLAPFDDSDLRPVQASLAEDDNAWPALLAAAEHLRWPAELGKRSGHFAAPDTWEADRVAELLAENQEAWRWLETALARDGIRVPAPQAFADDYDYLADWRRLATLALIRAEDLFRSGREAEAVAAVIEVVRLGHTLQDSGGVLIHYLVGASISRAALEKLQALTAQTSLPPEALRESIRQLAPCGVSTEGLANVLKNEYRMTLEFLVDLAAGRVNEAPISAWGQLAMGIGSKPFFSIARSRERLAGLARAAVADVDRPYADTGRAGRAVPTEDPSPLRLILSGNAIGNVLIDMLSPAWERVLINKCREQVRHRATLLLLALKAYHAEHGDLPDTLEELVPKYLTAVPLDDFDGQPLRYLKAERRIYSVGAQSIDSARSADNGATQDPGLEFPIGF